QSGTLRANGVGIFNDVSSFTASGAAVWSITTSSGIQVNGQGMVSAGSFKGDGSLLSGLTKSLNGAAAFTASGVYNVPAGVTKVLVLVVGGGGGGGGVTGAAANFGAAGGGGGGGCARDFVDLSGVPNVTVTVSTGANGGAAGNNPGTAASPTSFGAYVSANGGAGGTGQTAGNTYAPVAGGAGGAGASGVLNATGSDGGIGFRLSGTTGHAGYGGASACAGGGESGPPVAAAAGNNGSNYGGGGSGALSTAGVNQAGGNGAPGAVLIWEFE
ncbi:MAG: hypothetical protein HY926_06715, partial [Elusimicrobia bacterium]|nr:hypothetical protein [Elusimicrobiota bacterium]